ncbi:MAG: tRNA (guanosine(37)-N1)-methyltransferase TrmD [Pseudomonadota bacterium]
MGFHINILTLFPELFPGFLGHSLSGRALTRGDWSLSAVNIRDFAGDKHKTVDDTPYGGGAGMVMRADVIESALLSLPTPGKCIYMSPRGLPLTHDKVVALTQSAPLTILCGRYEGVDQRVLDAHNFEEISIGDYVLSGGEQAAMILMDACIRLLPDVMGNVDTASEESFTDGLLEYPHYTRPAAWQDATGATHAVPDVLQSGNHAAIAQWRHAQSVTLTQERRPDLLRKK